MDVKSVSLDEIPESFRGPLRQQLEPEERVAAILRVDLDEQLQFADRVVLLTDRRIVVVSAGAVGPAGVAGCAVAAWPLSEIASIDTHDRGGLGQLEIYGHAARLANLHYTLGRAGAVRNLVDRFAALRRGEPPQDGEASDFEDTVPNAEEPPLIASVGAMLRLLRFGRQRVGGILKGIFLTLATTAFSLVAPYLTWPLMDDILIPYDNRVENVRTLLENEEITPAVAEEAAARKQTIRDEGKPLFQKVPYYLGLMVVAVLMTWVLGWWQGWELARLSERISADLRNSMYNHLLRMSLDFFSAKRTGDLQSRISSDTDRICNFLSDSLTDFVSDVLMIVGTVGVLVWLDPLLGLATVCALPLVGGLTWWIRESLQHGFLTGGRAWADMTSILSDTIPGIRVVKAFAQERRESERFKAANDRIVAANDRVNRVWTFFWPMVALLNQVGLLVVWVVGSWQIFNQKISVGMLVTALAYINRIYARLESMSRMATNTQRAAASAQRIFEVLDRVSSVPEPARPVSPGDLKGAIEVKNISFRYGNRQVIDSVSLGIRPGEMIGLVGTTGAGKSTLVNLVCRFYDVSDGAILVDGVDIRGFRVAEFRRHIGIVLQDPFLFYGTIAENIAYGKPEATREEIIAAARAARAHEFILQLPDGYDSLVGERGQTLSGGERQRISIARALLIDPRILILDEATSSVDTQTERQIQEALDNLVRGRTTIAIAHRLSTLRKADRLVVLEHGRIVETGQHEDLLANPSGAYAKLYRAQMQLSKDFGPHTECDGDAPTGDM